LETTQESESSEPLIGFLAYLDQNIMAQKPNVKKFYSDKR